MSTTKRGARGAGMIRQRPDGRWEARYTAGRDPGTGKQLQKSIYGKTQDEVRQKLREATKDVDEGMYVDSKAMTLGGWLDQWLANFTLNTKDTTHRSYKDIIRVHIKPNLGAVKLSKLTLVYIQQFYAKLSDKGLSPKTIRNIHVVLHKALKDATKPPRSLLKYNPSDGAILPTVVRKEKRILSDDEIQKLVTTMKDHWHFPIYHTALFCGMRRGEVLGMELSRYEKYRAEKKIELASQLQRERKIGGKIRLVPLKNNRQRTIYPCSAVFDVIDEHIALRNALKETSGESWDDSGLLFTNKNGGPLDADAVYKSFKRLLQKSGIDPEGLNIHSLRHTYSTITLENGVDVKTLQEDLGHYDPGFTLRQYGHSTTKMKEAAREKMEKYHAEIGHKSTT